MIRKKVVANLSILFAIIFLCTGCLSKKDEPKAISNSAVVNKQEPKTTSKPVLKEERYDMYSLTPYELPLYSIVEISKLPTSIKIVVDKLLEKAQGFYLLHNVGDKIFIIMQNPVIESYTYRRHGLQFAEIDKDGHIAYYDAGYVGLQGETLEDSFTDYDDWVFDKDSEIKRPMKHTAYDEKGKVRFVETWCYDENEPIKYQMRDSNKRTISILKESQESDSNYRKEHIFYDNEGNIKISLTINYDGANISRVTFYNSHDSIDSMSIISEFIDGVKVKEQIYNENYELINTVVSEYESDERKCIKILDSEGNVVNKISS